MADENVTLPGTDGGQQGTPTAFYDNAGLSAEEIGYIQSSKYDSWSGVLKALKDTKSYVGMDKNELIRVPKPDKDGNVDYSDVFKALGRPEDATGYGLPDTEFAKAIAPELHKLGITKKQAEALTTFLDSYNENAGKAAQDAFTAKLQEQKKSLEKEWGANYGAYEQSTAEYIRNLARETGMTQEDFAVLEGALGFDKAMKMFFAMSGKENGIRTLSGYNGNQETPEIAAMKIKELNADKEFVAKLGKQDPKAVEEMKRLVAIAAKRS